MALALGPAWRPLGPVAAPRQGTWPDGQRPTGAGLSGLVAPTGPSLCHIPAPLPVAPVTALAA